MGSKAGDISFLVAAVIAVVALPPMIAFGRGGLPPPPAPPSRAPRPAPPPPPVPPPAPHQSRAGGREGREPACVQRNKAPACPRRGRQGTLPNWPRRDL